VYIHGGVVVGEEEGVACKSPCRSFSPLRFCICTMKLQTVSLLLGLAHLALSTSVSQNGKCGVAYGRGYTCLGSSKSL
jgi:hypothetical protein